MRVTALLMLAFAGLFSLWAVTGIQIMRCALGITHAEDMEFDQPIRPGEWLFGVAIARGESGGVYYHRNGESF